MKKTFAILVLVCFVIIPFKIFSQTLTIQETLDYINEKLNLDGNKDYGLHSYTYEWRITKDGKLMIKTFSNKKLQTEESVYLKQLDTNFVEVTAFGLIKIFTKNPTIDYRFIKSEYPKEEVIYPSDMIGLMFKNDKILTNQIKNAIDHLIISGKAKKEYREKDPFSY